MIARTLLFTIYVWTILALCAPGAGCASLVSPERYPVFIQSEPEGAIVQVYRGDSGKKKRDPELDGNYVTPITLSLDLSRRVFLRFEKDGYRILVRSFPRQWNPASCGILSVPVDYWTGDLYAPAKGSLEVELEQNDPAPGDQPVDSFQGSHR